MFSLCQWLKRIYLRRKQIWRRTYSKIFYFPGIDYMFCLSITVHCCLSHFTISHTSVLFGTASLAMLEVKVVSVLSRVLTTCIIFTIYDIFCRRWRPTSSTTSSSWSYMHYIYYIWYFLKEVETDQFHNFFLPELHVLYLLYMIFSVGGGDRPVPQLLPPGAEAGRLRWHFLRKVQGANHDRGRPQIRGRMCNLLQDKQVCNPLKPITIEIYAFFKTVIFMTILWLE